MWQFFIYRIMGSLVIKRENEIINAFFDFHIFINSKRVGSISNNSTRQWQLPPGNYTIEAKGGYYVQSQKLKIEIKTDEIKAYKVGSFGKSYINSFLQFKPLYRNFDNKFR